MTSIPLTAAHCKFCSGTLRFDFDRSKRVNGFSYYRCEDCGLSNVFALPERAETSAVTSH